MTPIIERATAQDIDGINHLLEQVLLVHHKGRPDLFRSSGKKYTTEELAKLLADDSRPVFTAKETDGQILGYAFCILSQYQDHNIMTNFKSLYIDDLCVDESTRGQHIGRALFDYVKDYAKKQGCYNLTLNVWSCNENARRFYEHCGLVPQKTTLETIL